MRGGQNGLLPRGEVAVAVIRQSLTHLKNFGAKSISIIVRPVTNINIVRYLLLKILALKGIYDIGQTGKIILASRVTVGSM